jgi:hypothetical protein
MAPMGPETRPKSKDIILTIFITSGGQMARPLEHIIKEAIIEGSFMRASAQCITIPNKQRQVYPWHQL